MCKKWGSRGKIKVFKKVLFDLDGTLTDPKIGITTCVQYALKHFGIDEDINNLTRFIGPPLIDSFMEYYGLSLEQAREAVDVYRERFAPIGKFENEVYPGIHKMLSKLKDKGIILAVASSKPEVFVKQILEHFELLDYFDIVVGSLLNETRTKKEEVLDEALKQLGVDYESMTFTEVDSLKSEIAMVGDRKFDVSSAAKMNITAVGVSYGYAEPGELEAENPDYIANTVEELSNYLLS